MQSAHAAVRARARTKGSRLAESQHQCETSIEFSPRTLIVLRREKEVLKTVVSVSELAAASAVRYVGEAGSQGPPPWRRLH